MKSPEQGGDTLVHAVVDPELSRQGGGLHLENHRQARVSSFCQDRHNQVKIFQALSIEIFLMVIFFLFRRSCGASHALSSR